MENKKYTLSDITTEEKEAFMGDFQKLCDQHEMYFEPVPQFIRKDMSAPWEIGVVVMLQKKTPATEDGSIPSTDPEVNPNA